GILKREWAVLPPLSRSAAMPEDVTARAIWPLEPQGSTIKSLLLVVDKISTFINSYGF
ncbi:14106_t:CDS:2, partial [Gigaspora margarita]